MKTTIDWAAQHSRRVVDDFRFRASCWWLRQQVEFLDWRMRLDEPSPLPHSEPAPAGRIHLCANDRDGGRHALPSL
jgi:hypothetical protein